jgi:ornithine decarboxylase
MKARFILSRSKLLEQYNIVKGLSDEVAYSLKTNPLVGRVLEENTECMFSVHFVNSLDIIKDKQRVWFIGQSLDKDVLNTVFDKGVRSFIIDNETDLSTLIDYVDKREFKIKLLLRMKMREYTIKTGKYYVFGMYTRQINKLIPQLRKNKNIDKLGIHFHRKTENISEWSVKDELTGSIEEETLRNIDILNIGGGIPVEYKNYSVDVLPYIFERIKELKEWLNRHDIKLIIEPGRFLAAPCIKLEAEIKSMHENTIIINCSVYNSAMDTFVAHIRLLVENEKESGKAYTIKGCTPDSMDVFRYRVYLNNPKIGDKIVFINAGAYTYSTDFCNLEKLETVITD